MRSPWRVRHSLSVSRVSRSIHGFGARSKYDSVCPYCAVGCGLNIYTKGGQVIDIEGNPDSPINEGTLCPKGANTFQLAINPHRVKHVLYRAPYSDQWETKPLDWAMDRIAQLRQGARDADFTQRSDGGPAAQPCDQHRHARRRDARQRRELPDQEALRRRAGGGVDREPGPDMTLRLGARSGRLVRPRRGHHFQQDLANSDCILIMGSNMAEAHPVGFRWPMKAKEKGAQADPRRSALHAHLGAVRPATSASAPAPTSRSSAG